MCYIRAVLQYDRAGEWTLDEEEIRNSRQKHGQSANRLSTLLLQLHRKKLELQYKSSLL
jgi:hypothetical protein